MNKTVTANISGIVFHIESQAYEKLHKYLTTIRNYFHDSDGKDEIMADIESRIAELFRESLNNGREVITLAEVNRVVEIMGEPEQYMDQAGDDYSEYEAPRASSNYKSKKLYRDEDDKILGGVCSGLGHYFGLDRIWLRAAFIIAVIAGFGTGIIIYIILWAIIPKAKSTAEKLEMKGEPINVENIGNTIKDEFNNFKKKVNNDTTQDYGRKAGNALTRFLDFIGKIIVFAFKFLVKAIAVILILAASAGLIGILAVAFGSPGDINVNGNHFAGYWSTEFAEIFFASGSSYTFGFIGIIFLTLIPLLAILYGGLKILFNIPSSNRAVGFTAIALWIIGIILVAVTATRTANEYKSKQIFSEEIMLPEIQGDTIRLSSLDEHYSNSLFNSHELFIEDGSIFIDNLEVDVVQGKSNEVVLILKKMSRGENRKDAGRRAENINIKYEVEDNVLAISPYLDFPYSDRFRTQEVQISIALPVGKSIFLENSSRDIIYDIKNVTNTYDGRMISHTWLMTEQGLACTDCEWIKSTNEEENENDEENEF